MVMTVVRYVGIAAGAIGLLAACAAGPDVTLADALGAGPPGGAAAEWATGEETDTPPMPGDKPVLFSGEPSGLVNPEDREATLVRLRTLADDRSRGAAPSAAALSAAELLRLRDTHGANALEDIEEAEAGR